MKLSLDDVVHHLVEFTLALACSELRDHVLLVLETPFLNFALSLLLHNCSRTHVEHTCRHPFDDFVAFHNRYEILSGQLRSLHGFGLQDSVAVFLFPTSSCDSTLTNSLHLVELEYLDVFLLCVALFRHVVVL